MSNIVAFLTSDLMFQSRVSSSAKAADWICIADRTVEKLASRISDAEQVKLVIVDLSLNIDDLPSTLEKIKQAFASATTIAYGPHVHETKLELATQSGFDQVLTRGQFDRQLPAMF